MTDRSVHICKMRKGTLKTSRSPPLQSQRNSAGGRPRKAGRPRRHPAGWSARRSGAQASSRPELDEFIARGFAATRLDDVARRAGVTQGTIYLHFTDKEALFQELVRTALVPLIGRLH